MSLRDYIATQVLFGFVSHMDSHTRKKYVDGRAEGRECLFAYALADKMLAARDESIVRHYTVTMIGKDGEVSR